MGAVIGASSETGLLSCSARARSLEEVPGTTRLPSCQNVKGPSKDKQSYMPSHNSLLLMVQLAPSVPVVIASASALTIL